MAKTNRPISKKSSQHSIHKARTKPAAALRAANGNRAEEELRASVARLDSIVHSAMDAIITLDADQRIVLFNTAAERMFRCEDTEAIGQSIDRFIPERFRAVHRDYIEKYGRTGITNRTMGHQIPLSGLRTDGEEFPVEASISQVDAAGTKLYTVILRDNTERKQAEQAMRHLAALVQSSDDAIISKTLDGIILSWNQGAERMYGYSASETIGQPISMLHPVELVDELSNILKQIKRGIPVERFETVRVKKDGKRIHVALTISPIRDSAGAVVAASTIARDITERKQTEQALRQHMIDLDARNAELDAFAHTVAHDLKSPIGLIIGYCEMLLTDSGSLTEPELNDRLQNILNNGRKLNIIIEELMLLAGLRQQEVQSEPISMSNVIDESLKRLEQSIQKSRATIYLPDQHDWPIALGYAPWLEEVWVNYLSNAIKHGGQPPRIELGAKTLPNHTIRFWVKDNGNGLSSEERSHLFTPFTRLNQVRAKGHGLGLSIVKRIIEKLGGKVGVDSELGYGSTFYFTLPAYNASTGSTKFF